MWQNLVKISSIKFHKNSFSGSQVVPCYWHSQANTRIFASSLYVHLELSSLHWCDKNEKYNESTLKKLPKSEHNSNNIFNKVFSGYITVSIC
jgi:hypothetical protein